MTYRYLIAYIDMHLGQLGSIEISLPDPIRNLNDLDQVTAEIRRHKGSNTVQVNSFSKFEEQ